MLKLQCMAGEEAAISLGQLSGAKVVTRYTWRIPLKEVIWITSRSLCKAELGKSGQFNSLSMYQEHAYRENIGIIDVRQMAHV